MAIFAQFCTVPAIDSESVLIQAYICIQWLVRSILRTWSQYSVTAGR